MRPSGYGAREWGSLGGPNLLRSRALLLGAIFIGAVMGVSTASAYFVLPNPTLDVGFTPMLPPLGYTKFCLHYPNDCKSSRIDFRRRNIKLTAERWYELRSVNKQINNTIIPALAEEWLLAPSVGNCKDYAITKRHELMLKGWPSRALLLSEVALSSGEHHLVLVVRVKGADLVLDNLNDDVRSVAATCGEYSWVKIQIPQNPNFWKKVRLLRTE
jgi:predicted transglutaminase-like cysteine proteinase